MFLNKKFKILKLLSINITALLCVYIYSVIVNDDLYTEVVIFPNNPGWYFVIYDETGDSHLESHLDINFAIDNENVFWADGRSLDEGSLETLFYINDGRGNMELLYKTKMRTYTEGNTARRIDGKLYTIRFIYLGDKPNSADYESSLSQLNLEGKIREKIRGQTP